MKIHIRITAKCGRHNWRDSMNSCAGLEDAAQMSEEMEEKCVETELKEQAKWMSYLHREQKNGGSFKSSKTEAVEISWKWRVLGSCPSSAIDPAQVTYHFWAP